MKIAYHTPTLELYKKQVQKWLDEGQEWAGGESGVCGYFWGICKGTTCVALNEHGKITCGDKNFYLSNNYQFMLTKTLETLEAGDFIKNGGNFGRILTAQGEGEYRTYDVSFLADNLEHERLKRHNCTFTAFELKEKGYEVYEPEEVPEYTMEEAIEKMGHSFKIKK